MQQEPAKFLKQRQVADMLGVTVRCLERWRARGEGPKFFKLVGQIRYLPSDVAAWLATRQKRFTNQTNR